LGPRPFKKNKKKERELDTPGETFEMHDEGMLLKPLNLNFTKKSTRFWKSSALQTEHEAFCFFLRMLDFLLRYPFKAFHNVEAVPGKMWVPW
jgi:hypothetical protein